MFRKVRVTQVEAAGPAEKMPTGPYSAWSVKVRYTCEDGQVFDAHKGFRLKRDAAAYLATLPGAPQRPLFVIVGDDGTAKGIEERFSLLA